RGGDQRTGQRQQSKIDGR
ncbi:hypothetical protein D030_4277B, partial [Vibrio parahaemolyticus AQ3810]